ncbi:sugar transferase [Enterococcus casseliflavus]|uniref:sugar transferase n=1 Tax=Enterococcus casseliflavus TaxID=37734 RepID=UPI0035CC45EF
MVNEEHTVNKSETSENGAISATLIAEKVNSKRLYLFVKRVIDMVGSAIGLIMLIPVFLIVAILMKIEEPLGPIFFSQTRIGKNEEEFKMFKIRSMCVDAEEKLAELLKHNEVDGAMFKMKEDPRITKVGKFIRKTSIDELPQLWNVLKGEMSLVGPRPPLVREVAEYSNYDKQRLLVKPGCTGLWQISGRNEVGFHEMVELDLEYIQKASIIKDIEIMVKTVYVMLKPNGAY